MKHLMIVALMAGLCLGLTQAAQADESGKTKTVTVTGMGVSEQAALRDAQRKAVEEAAGTIIVSESKTKDFTLVRDTVYAKSAGFIKGFDKISSREMADGTWEMKIKAEVSIQGVVDTVATVKNLLQQVGRPKIMVWMKETIENVERHHAVETVEDSIVSARVEQMLLDSGFILVDRDRVKELIEREKILAAAEDNAEKKLLALARQEKAAIFITGTASATAGDSSRDDGMSIFTYEGQANIKCLNADTAELIYKVPGKPTRGVQRVWKSAAQQALKFQADQIAPQIQQHILEHWMEWLQGGGQLEIQIENLSFENFVKVKDALKSVKEFKDIDLQLDNEVATCSIQSDRRAQEIAEQIIKTVKDIKITGVTAKTIKAKYVGKD